MKDKIYSKLETLFGEDIFVIKDIPERYFHDESTVYSNVPDAVFLPSAEDQILELMKIAKKEKLNIVPRGRGTGVCGGAVAVSGGIILSTERLSNITELDEKNMCITVQPGICNAEVKAFLEVRNYYYPPDPQSYETSSIGGNVATNAGGPRAVKYGTTKNYVMSLRVITGSGKLISTGGKTYKFSSGYNLNEIFCGSEGTLGIITGITLKYLPIHPKRSLLLIPFHDLSCACAFLNEAFKERIDFSAFEFIDDTSKTFVERFLNNRLPCSERADCYVFAELENEDNKGLDKLSELAVKFKGEDIFLACDRVQEERLWEARKKISEAFKAQSRYIYKADIVVPRGRIADFVAMAKTFSSEELPLACFGHVGDGNVHVNLLDIDGTMSVKAKMVMKSLMDCVKKCNGFPSGEHGIGVAKKEYLKFFFPPAHIGILRQIKRVFDPANIMNKGKIF